MTDPKQHKVLDGDSVIIPGIPGNEVRFYTGNAPEHQNLGLAVEHKSARKAVSSAGGQAAATAVEIAQGPSLGFNNVSLTGEEDHYGRSLGTMVDGAGNSLAHEMVAAGLNQPTSWRSIDSKGSAGIAYAGKLDPYGTAFRNDPRIQLLRIKAQDETMAALNELAANASDVLLGLEGNKTQGHDWREDSKAGLGTAFAKAFGRGVDNTQGTLYGFANVMGQITDIDILSKYGKEGMLENIGAALKNPAKLAVSDDVETLADWGLFAVEVMGAQAPQVALDLMVGLGTGGVAGAGLAVSRKAMAGVGLATIRGFGGASAAAKFGVGASMFVQATGEQHLSQLSEGVDNPFTALATAVPMAALDFAGIDRVIDAVVKPGLKVAAGASRTEKLMGGFLDIGEATLKAGLAETPTEALQALTQELSLNAQVKGREVDWGNVKESAIQGGIAGGAMGAGGRTVRNALGGHIEREEAPNVETDGTDRADRLLEEFEAFQRKLEAADAARQTNPLADTQAVDIGGVFPDAAPSVDLTDSQEATGQNNPLAGVEAVPLSPTSTVTDTAPESDATIKVQLDNMTEGEARHFTSENAEVAKAEADARGLASRLTEGGQLQVALTPEALEALPVNPTEEQNAQALGILQDKATAMADPTGFTTVQARDKDGKILHEQLVGNSRAAEVEALYAKKYPGARIVNQSGEKTLQDRAAQVEAESLVQAPKPAVGAAQTPVLDTPAAEAPAAAPLEGKQTIKTLRSASDEQLAATLQALGHDPVKYQRAQEIATELEAVDQDGRTDARMQQYAAEVISASIASELVARALGTSPSGTRLPLGLPAEFGAVLGLSPEQVQPPKGKRQKGWYENFEANVAGAIQRLGAKAEAEIANRLAQLPLKTLADSRMTGGAIKAVRTANGKKMSLRNKQVQVLDRNAAIRLILQPKKSAGRQMGLLGKLTPTTQNRAPLASKKQVLEQAQEKARLREQQTKVEAAAKKERLAAKIKEGKQKLEDQRRKAAAAKEDKAAIVAAKEAVEKENRAVAEAEAKEQQQQIKDGTLPLLDMPPRDAEGKEKTSLREALREQMKKALSKKLAAIERARKADQAVRAAKVLVDLSGKDNEEARGEAIAKINAEKPAADDIATIAFKKAMGLAQDGDDVLGAVRAAIDAMEILADSEQDAGRMDTVNFGEFIAFLDTIPVYIDMPSASIKAVGQNAVARPTLQDPAMRELYTGVMVALGRMPTPKIVAAAKPVDNTPVDVVQERTPKSTKYNRKPVSVEQVNKFAESLEAAFTALNGPLRWIYQKVTDPRASKLAFQKFLVEQGLAEPGQKGTQKLVAALRAYNEAVQQVEAGYEQGEQDTTSLDEDAHYFELVAAQGSQAASIARLEAEQLAVLLEMGDRGDRAHRRAVVQALSILMPPETLGLRRATAKEQKAGAPRYVEIGDNKTAEQIDIRLKQEEGNASRISRAVMNVAIIEDLAGALTVDMVLDIAAAFPEIGHFTPVELRRAVKAVDVDMVRAIKQRAVARNAVADPTLEVALFEGTFNLLGTAIIDPATRDQGIEMLREILDAIPDYNTMADIVALDTNQRDEFIASDELRAGKKANNKGDSRQPAQVTSPEDSALKQFGWFVRKSRAWATLAGGVRKRYARRAGTPRIFDTHNVVAIDFETFYDEVGGYSLKAMGQQAYLDDPRFNIQLLSVQRTGQEPLILRTEGEIRGFFAALRAEGKPVMLAAHNARFDAEVLKKVLGQEFINPDHKDAWIDTLELFRSASPDSKDAVSGRRSHKLGLMATELKGLGKKLDDKNVDDLVAVSGISKLEDMSPDVLARFELYALNDARTVMAALEHYDPDQSEGGYIEQSQRVLAYQRGQDAVINADEVIFRQDESAANTKAAGGRNLIRLEYTDNGHTASTLIDAVRLASYGQGGEGKPRTVAEAYSNLKENLSRLMTAPRVDAKGVPVDTPSVAFDGVLTGDTVVFISPDGAVSTVADAEAWLATTARKAEGKARAEHTREEVGTLVRLLDEAIGRTLLSQKHEVDSPGEIAVEAWTARLTDGVAAAKKVLSGAVGDLTKAREIYKQLGMIQWASNSATMAKGKNAHITQANKHLLSGLFDGKVVTLNDMFEKRGELLSTLATAVRRSKEEVDGDDRQGDGLTAEEEALAKARLENYETTEEWIVDSLDESTARAADRSGKAPDEPGRRLNDDAPDTQVGNTAKEQDAHLAEQTRAARDAWVTANDGTKHMSELQRRQYEIRREAEYQKAKAALEAQIEAQAVKGTRTSERKLPGLIDELNALKEAHYGVITGVGGTRYKLGQHEGKGIPLVVANAVALRMKQASGLTVKVVQHESQLPEGVREAIEKDGATGLVAGVYHGGISYIVADNIRDAHHAIATVLHEAVGHGGVKAVLGDRLQAVMGRIYKSIPIDVEAELRDRYADQIDGMSETEAEAHIAEEYVAQLAESDPKNSLLASVVAAIKAGIRKIFGDKMAGDWSHAEIVRLLAGAKVAAARGTEAAGTNYAREQGASNLVRMYTAGYDSDTQYGRSTSTDMEQIVRDFLPDDERIVTHRVQAVPEGSGVESKRMAPSIEVSRMVNGEPVVDFTIFDIESDTPFFEIGNKHGQRGVKAMALYVAGMQWIHNNGKKLRVDPRGVTPLNHLRRTEAMIASIMRTGTTAHLTPYYGQWAGFLNERHYAYADDINGKIDPDSDAYARMNELQSELWGDETKAKTEAERLAIRDANLNNLIVAATVMAERRLPAIRDLTTNSKGEIFERVHPANTSAVVENPRPLDERSLFARIKILTASHLTHGVGEATVRRAIAARSLLSQDTGVDSDVSGFGELRGWKDAVQSFGQEGALPDRARGILPPAILSRLGEANSRARAFYSLTSPEAAGPKEKVIATKLDIMATQSKRAWKSGIMPAFRTVFARANKRIAEFDPLLSRMLHQSANTDSTGERAYEQRQVLVRQRLQGLYGQASKAMNGEFGKGAMQRGLAELAMGKAESAEAKAVKKFVGELQQAVREAGLKSVLFRGIEPPMVFDRRNVENRLQEFQRRLLVSGLLPEQVRQIVTGVLRGDTSVEMSMAPGLPVGDHMMSHVITQAIPRAELQREGWLLSSHEEAMFHWIEGASKRAAWDSVFGEYGSMDSSISQRYFGVDRMSNEQMAEMVAAGIITEGGEFFHTNAKFVKRLNMIEAVYGANARGEVLALVNGAMGRHPAGVNMPASYRKSQDFVVSWVGKTILAFSGVASIPELGLGIARAHGRVSVTDAFRNIKEASDFAKNTGTVLANALEYLAWAGDQYQPVWQNKIDNAFFRLNGNTMITNASRVLSTAVAIEYLGQLSKDGDRAALARLNVSKESVDAWNDMGRPQWSMEQDAETRQLTAEVTDAINQFVNESSLRPSRFQATHWGNNPYMKAIWHLKHFMYAYADMILGNAWRESRRLYKSSGQKAADAFLIASPAAVFVVMALPLAMVSGESRDWIRKWNGERSKFGRDGSNEYLDRLLEGVTRSGVFGPSEMLFGFARQAGWGNPLAGVAPTLGVATKLYGHSNIGTEGKDAEWSEMARTLVPFLSQNKGLWQMVAD